MKFLLGTLILCSTTALYSWHHRIIYLVSTPRSLSTVFVRAMQARGDMAIFNEPAQKAWNPNLTLLSDNWYRPEAPLMHAQVVDQFLHEAQTKPVFAKDQSYIVQDLVDHDARLVNDPDVAFAFLLRNPHHTIISFYKRVGQIVDNFSEFIGYKYSYDLFVDLKNKTGKRPVIVLTEELYTNPEATIRKFCNDVKIPYVEHALNWHSLGDDFDGTQAWHEPKTFDMTHHWHKDAILSTGFKQPTQYEVDQHGQPTFSEIANPEHRHACIQAYEENLKYYHAILDF